MRLGWAARTCNTATVFGSVAWPPVDPNGSTKVEKIPAVLCYENGPKNGGAFDPAGCYGP
jgi:hypothetical protein